MKTKILFISLVALIAVFSCKKEECETCPSTELQSVVGNWRLVEYREEKISFWGRTSSNNINDDLYIDNDVNYIVEMFYNNTYTEAYIDSANNYDSHKYYDESILDFGNYLDEYKSAYVEQTEYKYSYEISINKDMWEANLVKNKNFYIKYYIEFDANNDTITYWIEYRDSLVNPNDSIMENGELFWNGFEINAGLMKGKVKSISSNEIIIEDIITYKKSHIEAPSYDSLYTYSDKYHPYLKAYGIFNYIYDDIDTYKIYSKWIAY